MKKPSAPISRKLLMFLGGSVVLAAVMTNHQVTTRQENETARVASLTDEQRKAEADARKKREAQLLVAQAGAVTLKHAAKDPLDFKLTSLIVKPNGTACYEYRAKNTFGAIFPGSAVLTVTGKFLIEERDKNVFVRTWNNECVKSGGDDITYLANLRLEK